MALKMFVKAIVGNLLLLVVTGSASPAPAGTPVQQGYRAPEIRYSRMLNAAHVSVSVVYDTMVLAFYDKQFFERLSKRGSRAVSPRSLGRRMVHELNRIYARKWREGVLVVGLSRQGTSATRELIKAYGIKHQIGSAARATWLSYRAGPERYLFIVKNGTVLWVGADVKILKEQIDRLEQLEKETQALIAARTGLAEWAPGSFIEDAGDSREGEWSADDEVRISTMKANMARDEADLRSLLTGIQSADVLGVEELKPLEDFYEMHLPAKDAPSHGYTRSSLFFGAFPELLKTGKVDQSGRQFITDMHLRALEDPDGVVRLNAAHGLSQLGEILDSTLDEEGYNRLHSAWEAETEPALREVLRRALNVAEGDRTDPDGNALRLARSVAPSSDPNHPQHETLRKAREYAQRFDNQQPPSREVRSVDELIRDYNDPAREGVGAESVENAMYVRTESMRQLIRWAGRLSNAEENRAIKEHIESAYQTEPEPYIRYLMATAYAEVYSSGKLGEAETRAMRQKMEEWAKAESEVSAARTVLTYVLIGKY